MSERRRALMQTKEEPYKEFWDNLHVGKAVGSNYIHGLNDAENFVVYAIPYVSNQSYEIKNCFNMTDTKNAVYGNGVAPTNWEFGIRESMRNYWSCRSRANIATQSTTIYGGSMIIVTLYLPTLDDAYILNRTTGEYVYKGKNVQ